MLDLSRDYSSSRKYLEQAMSLAKEIGNKQLEAMATHEYARLECKVQQTQLSGFAMIEK